MSGQLMNMPPSMLADARHQPFVHPVGADLSFEMSTGSSAAPPTASPAHRDDDPH
jgi:hypothetical protein